MRYSALRSTLRNKRLLYNASVTVVPYSCNHQLSCAIAAVVVLIKYSLELSLHAYSFNCIQLLCASCIHATLALCIHYTARYIRWYQVSSRRTLVPERWLAVDIQALNRQLRAALPEQLQDEADMQSAVEVTLHLVIQRVYIHIV
jgi:hypothetical protein